MCAIVVFGLSFILLIASMLHRVKTNRVALFENGIAVESEGIVETAGWDEVLHYYHCAMGAPFVLKLRKGGEISISNETVGFTNLCSEIRMRAGEHIFLREYALRLEGFRLDGKQMEWSDIQRMYSRVTNGQETLAFETSSLLTGFGPSVDANKLPSVQSLLQADRATGPEPAAIYAVRA